MLKSHSKFFMLKSQDFARNGEKGFTSVIAADQLVTFTLAEWQYDSACPVLGEIFRVPDLIDDVRQTTNDIIATGFKHFRRNLADTRGSVIFQQLHSLFYLSLAIWMNLLEFVKVLFLKVMQLCKPICASRTLRCCFARYELVRTTAKAL